jgi:hypothetical protein
MFFALFIYILSLKTYIASSLSLALLKPQLLFVLIPCPFSSLFVLLSLPEAQIGEGKGKRAYIKEAAPPLLS